MDGNSSNIVKKKIKLIEGLAINKSFCKNKVVIPSFLLDKESEKNITLDHISAASNIARLMKEE